MQKMQKNIQKINKYYLNINDDISQIYYKEIKSSIQQLNNFSQDSKQKPFLCFEDLIIQDYISNYEKEIANTSSIIRATKKIKIKW